MKKWFLYLILSFLSLNIFGQTCTIFSKANNITPDKLCSPVIAVWNVSYTGVNDAGTPVSIQFDWNNGTVVDVPAVMVGPGIFQATATNTYTSAGDVCNYHPQAMLRVNGVLCTSSAQEQIVTVWDDDNHNGGRMHIDPTVYPICFGNGADVRFQDLTLFNCVPPQERDNPNINTRWIQWIYGTDITMTGIPVTIDGHSTMYPDTARIITLPGPVTGSGVYSDVMNVANDKLVGQYFQVTLRNWNYCNPYDDPSIPGQPRDKVNGDFPPVVTTAIILIVPYPDAAINPVDSMCSNANPVTLTSVSPNGEWSGPGVSGNIFNPTVAGPGNHRIIHTITSGEGCSDSDTTYIRVSPIPDPTISAPSIVCSSDAPVTLVAHDPGGTWIGAGVVGNVFDPILAGSGNHRIIYSINVSGCSNSDTTTITVATPNATITPVDTLCVNSTPITVNTHDLGGIWTGLGMIGNVFHPEITGPGDHLIVYNIVNTDCQDVDSTIVTVMPIPNIEIQQVGTIFLNRPSVVLHATPEGGIWSGIGVVGSTFDPKIADIGEHVVTYTIPPDQWGCTTFDTIHIQVVLPPVPLAYFAPDTVGCNPMVVTFRNLSVYGESYLWDFGDRSYSNEFNPVHTYNLPGSYIVRLTVYNIAGSSFHQGMVTVFQSPIASFDYYPKDIYSNTQIVTFYNYSQYADYYAWDFGDGTELSYDINPWHKYENEGSYWVTLYAKNDYGCSDNVLSNLPITVKWSGGTIKFPNAFKWNGSGPTGGQWQEGVYSEMDYVFRPHFENVIEYYLQIFNRWGVLIYESRDLMKGWDGYFEDGNLAPQGVYVWRASGRYINGDYFEKVGDVTFLR